MINIGALLYMVEGSEQDLVDLNVWFWAQANFCYSPGFIKNGSLFWSGQKGQKEKAYKFVKSQVRVQ